MGDGSRPIAAAYGGLHSARSWPLNAGNRLSAVCGMTKDFAEPIA